MSSLPTRIAYFGLPLGALALARAGYEPVAIVLGRREALGTRRLQRELGARLPILTVPELEEPHAMQMLERVRPDAILSWFYPRRIPVAVLRLARLGGFGTHPSLLPRWRGPDPYFWAIYSGDAVTGVSLHRLEADYDTGAVIEQLPVPIEPGENAWGLAKRLDRPALRLLVACARRLAAGERLGGREQDPAAATPAPAPSETMLVIDWRRQVDEIVRLVRAAAPYPAASAELGSEVVDVLAAAEYGAPLPRALEPADAVCTPRGLVVRATDGGVLIERARLDTGRVLEGPALLGLFPGGLSRVGFARANSDTTDT